MIICHSKQSSSEFRRLVLVFGVGLIGRSILAALMCRDEMTVESFPFNWTDKNRRDYEADKILDFIKSLSQKYSRVSRFDIVWSAGCGGFTSKQSEFDSESCAFNTLLLFSQKLRELIPTANACFHLFSSAGGLFEGQRFVDSNSLPKPLRPYGELKLSQEKHLYKSLYSQYHLLIYRPSSVYGLSVAGNRKGLISTLLYCAERGQVAQMYGGQDTLRDFVCVEDIAHFVVGKIYCNTLSNLTYMLVSAKPTAMVEVIKTIEDVVDKRLYLHFWSATSNALDNSYSQSILPDGWNPIDLRTGVAKTFLQTKLYLNGGA